MPVQPGRRAIMTLSEPRARTATSRLLRAANGGSLLIAASVAVAIVVALLLGVALETAVQDPTAQFGFSFRSFVELYTNPLLHSVIGNTILFTVISAGTALFFALPSAFLVQRTTLPYKGLVFALVLVSALVPGYVTARAWVLLFHPRIGLVNELLVDGLPFVDSPPINVVHVPIMGFINGLTLSAVAFFMLAGVFRPMDPALEESAEIHGLGVLARLRWITLPLAYHGILAAGIFVVMLSIASIDIPRIIGLSGRIFLFSTVISGDVLGAVRASSVFFILLALVMSFWYLRVMRAPYRYAVVSGQNYRVKLIALSRRQLLGAWSFIALFGLLSAGLPLLTLFWVSLTPFLEVPSAEALGRVSLANYATVSLDGRFWVAARNTVFLIAVVPTTTVLLSLAISWVVTRSAIRARSVLDTVAFLPHAVPSILFAIAAVHISLHWLPFFYRTAYVVFFIFIITRISFPTRVLNSALLQIHRELDEAGYVSGLGTLAVIRKILVPLLWSPMTYAWLWVALVTYREASLASLLRAPTPTLATFASGQLGGGNLNEGAALALVLLAVVTGLAMTVLVLSARGSRAAG